MDEANPADLIPECSNDVPGLVAGLLARDSEACEELCSRYGRILHRYLSGLLRGDRDLAEDLMVHTLAEAVRCIGRYDARRAGFTAWLFGIANRVARGERRRQARRSSVPQAAEVPLDRIAESASPADLATSLTESLAAQRSVARLRECLSETEMEVLVLHYVYQFSLQEIAATIGRSGRAVESLLHRAKRKARERLAEDA